MNKKRPSKTGLIVLTIILILIAIPVSIIMMMKPGNKQWDRITVPKSNVSALESELNDNSIILQEAWLERRIADLFNLINEETPDFQIAGSDLTLETDNVSFLIGAALPHPFSSNGKTIKAALEASMSVFMTDNRELKLQIESFKVGRLPIPVKLLTKVQAIKTSLNTENLLKGRDAEFDLETLSLSVNLDDMMDEVSPGSRIIDFGILNKKISITVSLSPEINSEIKKLAMKMKAPVSDLNRAFIEKLPEEKTESLIQATAVINELTEIDTDKTAPALFNILNIYTDFYLALTPEEQEKLELIIDEYVEENPEVMRELALFAEEQGWTEEITE